MSNYLVLDVEAQNPVVKQHVKRVANRTYRLPEFQRTFVWDNDRVLKLWDSLYRGFPIGQLMLWKPDSEDFPMRGLGRNQAELQSNGQCEAIIDGQQRLTALYLVLTGDIRLRFDLERDRFTYSEGENCLRLDVLRDLDGRPIEFDDAAGRQFFNRHATEAQRSTFGLVIDHLNGILTERQLPSQLIKSANYATVLGVFKRLNQQGEPLNEAQLTLAGISPHWPGVFRRTYSLLLRMNSEMGFDRADDPTFVFQVWTAVHTQQHLIRHLAPEDERSKYKRLVDQRLYEDSWSRTERGISSLIEIMQRDLDLTNFQFIKAYYPLQVVAHYLASHDEPSDEEIKSLRRWLILSLVSGRYHESALSKYGADIKATTEKKSLQDLFSHKGNVLDPAIVQTTLVDTDRLLSATFRSAYVTLLYLISRQLEATDWMKTEIKVGEQLEDGPWHFHHIFPDERFDGERARLRDELEDAQSRGDHEVARTLEQERQRLEDRVASVANLAFLIPPTNQSIGNRAPIDYLAELASTPSGRKALESQLVPLDPDLWKQPAFELFRRRRCELIVAKAKELFF
ncbi:MAG: hypothetical protein A3G93_07975 [Nitrospinae bacterium RIFCSPLOWO2_12_FULL_45_22]|nr:MAG: hypothetical protein A3G93_07975 [Nitrospinae bacterium RIFCSPLOWO2_12_FULL_45_22]